jgi:type VI secretion system secreted protein Hcp
MSIATSFRACAVAALAALTVLLAIPLSAHAAQDLYLKFDNDSPISRGLVGESTDKALPGAISLKEFSWSLENPTTIGSAGGGAGAGKAKFEPLTIKKLVDSSSPALMLAAGSGAPIPGATIVVRNGNAGAPDAYLQYRLKSVFVTRVESSAAEGDEGVTETVELRYGSLTQRYVQTKSNGVKTPIVNGWDQVVNDQMTDWSGPVLG